MSDIVNLIREYSRFSDFWKMCDYKIGHTYVEPWLDFTYFLRKRMGVLDPLRKSRRQKEEEEIVQEVLDTFKGVEMTEDNIQKLTAEVSKKLKILAENHKKRQ